LGLKRIICPPSAGVASAAGLLVAPARVDRVTTVGMRLDKRDWRALEEVYRRLEQEAREVLEAGGDQGGRFTARRFADARCVGQGFDLVISLPPGPYDSAAPEDVEAALKNAFISAYKERFTRHPPAVPIEFIHARVSVAREMREHDTDLRWMAEAGDPLKGHREVFFPETCGFTRSAVYDRSRLTPGTVLKGPAIIEESGSTLVVGPTGTFTVLPSHSIVVSLV
jgi:N-methylhydantoinase A